MNQRKDLPEIDLGAKLCKAIKRMYYSNVPWIDCYQKVAKDFTSLKARARIYYPDKKDVDILKELQNYAEFDLRDLMEVKT